MPDWHILYEAAVDEMNPGVLEHLVYEMEAAVWCRLRGLSKNQTVRSN
jgi:hypothetical protein